MLQTAGSLRPRSRPASWGRRQPTKGWRLPSVDARSLKPKGSLTVWGRARRLLWSWWPWAVISIWALIDDKWGWAIGAGTMGLLAYLTAPAALPPRYGLSHEFDIESEEFLNTVAGASSTPFVSGNTVEPLNNGDEFYPAMLHDDRAGAERLDHDRGVHLLGGRHRPAVRARARRSERRAGMTVKILLDAIGSATIGADILASWRTADVSSPGTTRFTGTRSAASTTARTASRSSSTAASATRAARASRITGSATREDPERLARHAGTDRRPGRRSRSRPGSRTTGYRRRASW